LKPRKPKVFYGYIIVGVAVCAMVMYWGTFYTFGIFFKPVLTDFGWTRAMTSAAFSINALFWGIMDMSAGKLNDMFGPRRVVTVYGLLLALGYLLMSQISDIWQLYLFYGVIVGSSMGGSFIPMLSAVARWFVKRRALMSGIVVTGIGLGTMFIPPLAARLIASYGWSTSYIMVGIIALLVIISAAQFLKRDPAEMGQSPDGADEVEVESLNTNARGLSLREALRTKQFWMFCAIFLGFLFCLNTIMVHIINHATDLKIPETTAANLLVIIGGVSIFSRLGMGALADKMGTKSALVASFVIFTMALFWLQIAQDLRMLYLFAVIFGLGYGGMVTLTSPLAADLFGLSSHGTILGIAFFVGAFGSATGPLLAGEIFDATGSYQRAFLICGILGIIGIILALSLRPTVSKGGTNDPGGSA